MIFNVSAKEFTTFKTGGTLSAIVFPSDKKHIEFLFGLSQKDIPVKFIGCGSNLLISDDGFDGVVAITKKISGIDYTENRLLVLSGTRISALLGFCINRGVRGPEFLAGIPGTIGGSLINNAGTKDNSIAHLVLSVEYMDKGGFWQKKEKNDIVWKYRYSGLKDYAFFVFSAELTVENGMSEEIKRKVAEIMKRRKSTQPLEYPSAGSIFKNPEGFYAGKLIEKAGLKRFEIGGAMVSEKTRKLHC